MNAADLLDLLGNANRRRILAILARKPRYVTEIGDLLGLSPKAVIDHLRRLEEAGLIESQSGQAGRKYYSISDPVRLEVLLTPYEFSLKRSYPRAVEVEETDSPVELDLPETDDPAAALDRLLAVRQELSLAQRRVEGHLAATLGAIADESAADRLGAAVLVAIATGDGDRASIARRVGVPPEDVARVLATLSGEGLIDRAADGWTLAA